MGAIKFHLAQNGAPDCRCLDIAMALVFTNLQHD